MTPGDMYDIRNIAHDRVCWYKSHDKLHVGLWTHFQVITASRMYHESGAYMRLCSLFFNLAQWRSCVSSVSSVWMCRAIHYLREVRLIAVLEEFTWQTPVHADTLITKGGTCEKCLTHARVPVNIVCTPILQRNHASDEEVACFSCSCSNNNKKKVHKRMRCTFSMHTQRCSVLHSRRRFELTTTC